MVVRTVDRNVTVQGRLSHVEVNYGGLGQLIIQGQDGAVVVRHDAVQTIGLLRRRLENHSLNESGEVRKEL